MGYLVVTFFSWLCLSSEDAGTTDGLDLLSGRLGEKLGLDNDGLLGQVTSAEHLEVTVLSNINDGSLLLALEVFDVETRDGPQAVEVNHRHVVLSALVVEVAHTDLTEVTRVILIEQGTVMVSTTSVTTTSWVLTVLANTTVTSRDVSSQLTCLLELSGHF